MKQLVQFASLIALAPFHLNSQPQITGVYNAASFQPGLPSGGGLAFVTCSSPLGWGVAPGTYTADSWSPLPNNPLNNPVGIVFQVSVNLGYAPILAVAVTASGGTTYATIQFQVPMERNASLLPVPGGGSVGYLETCGAAQILTPLPPRPPGTFFSDDNYFVTALHASDSSAVTSNNPAQPGETIIAYADDVFQSWPPPPIGFPTPAEPLFKPTGLPSSQYVGGLVTPGYLYLQYLPIPDFFNGYIYPTTHPVQTTFEGLAKGMIGVQEIDFVVPADQQPGTYSLFFNDGCPPGYTGSDGCAIFPFTSPIVLLQVGKSQGTPSASPRCKQSVLLPFGHIFPPLPPASGH